MFAVQNTNSLFYPFFIAESAESTLECGRRFATHIEAGDTVYLSGDLGVGKTTFCQGVLQQLGCEEAVQSPTFAIVKSYNLKQIIINHFDLYRIKSAQELVNIGMCDYIEPRSVQIIEWPEKGKGSIPLASWQVDLSYHHQHRKIVIQCFR